MPSIMRLFKRHSSVNAVSVLKNKIFDSLNHYFFHNCYFVSHQFISIEINCCNKFSIKCKFSSCESFLKKRFNISDIQSKKRDLVRNSFEKLILELLFKTNSGKKKFHYNVLNKEVATSKLFWVFSWLFCTRKQ